MTTETTWDPNWDRNELPAPRLAACGTCLHPAVSHWTTCHEPACPCTAYVPDPNDI